MVGNINRKRFVKKKTGVRFKKSHYIESLKDKDTSSKLKTETSNQYADAVYRQINFDRVPLVPMRDIVVFPNTITSIFVGRSRSIKAIEAAVSSDRYIFVVLQKDPNAEEITQDNIENIGVLAKITQSVKLPDGTVKLLIDGVYRGNLRRLIFSKSYIEADINVTAIQNINESASNPVFVGLMRKINDALYEHITFNKRGGQEILRTISQITNPEIYCDIVSSYLNIDILKKKAILSVFDLKERMELLLRFILEENDILKVERDLHDKVKRQMDKSHKEFYLQEQIKAIRRELGDGDGINDVIEKYEKIMSERLMPEHVIEKINDEIRRLRHTTNSSSEAGVIKTYLELLFDLPWNESSDLNSDIKYAEKLLSSSHYGMDKAKERILESLAVQIKTNQSKKTILCLYGPPGVGKTSLARSIADAMGRKYIKVSLGGISDESEIRGHRKTYIGAMPGKIIQAMKKAKVNNPVILLDEIDKLGRDHRGDPAAAMLELLDPEQNKNFNDHYLEIDYDLSNVMFIATANSLNISKPLLDRMELIKIPTYLEQEKFTIAKKYIIAKKMKENGLSELEIKLSDGAVMDVIKYYTRESGVRELERQIDKICRKAVLRDLKEDGIIKITSKNLDKFLGIKKFEHTEIDRESIPGVINGLAYTEVGGDVLLIEAVKIPEGKGEIKFTGKLGDVMKESIQIAHSLVKSNAKLFNIDVDSIKNCDVHLHVPEGATPKDGPSAGITIVSALVSLYTGKPVKNTIGMTGEVTLRGAVLPIGGLREKLVSALRSGIKTVIIPKDNIKDLEEIPSYITSELQIIPCSKIEEVMRAIF